MEKRGDNIDKFDKSIIERYKKSYETQKKFYKSCLKEYNEIGLMNKPILLNCENNPKKNAEQILKIINLIKWRFYFLVMLVECINTFK